MQDREVDGLREAIAALDTQRTALGDTLVDAAVAPLLERLGALDAQRPPVEPVRRLRQVSVLFLDIVGSTELIQHLEPEDVQSVVDGALAAFTGLVRQHGGEVLRYAGDNIKAAFGADGTREDDADRAVNCGLALLHEARQRGDAVQQAHGLAGFDARVGIHTGAAVRGGGVEQDNSLSGLAVNIAARMEQAAPPGTLRISMDTYRLVQGRFNVLEQPTLLVKGLQEPMRTFLVQGVRERRLRGLRHGADGVTTAMVARDDELGRLQQVASAVFTPGGGLGAATAIGDAGLGKSRLLAEFQAALPAQAQGLSLWRASSHPQAIYQPYGLLRDLLFWHLGVRDSDTQVEAQQTFSTALRPVFGEAADEHTALLGQLIGLDYSDSPFIAGILRDGKQLQGRGLNAWVRCLKFQAALQPLVLVLDDLQWADDESLNALDHLVAAAPDSPVLLLCAARPELLQRRPQWGALWPGHELIALSPLATRGSDALATALLTRFATPVPALQALLSEQSAGNPYYMESLLQMLVDTGVIQAANEHWEVQEERLQGLKVPATLVGVLQATLDVLGGQARRSVQQASVVGPQFWDEALAAIDPQAPEQLPGLGQRELVLPRAESAFEGTREFSFRHHLLHQVTYGTVLKPDKREAHGHTARWLQGRSQGRENELASQIAEHFERAGDTEQAIAYWLLAAEDASRRQADTAALVHADRALALDDRTDLRRQTRLHLVRAKVFMRGGRAVEHSQEVERLELLADQLDDDVLRLSVAYDRLYALMMEGQYEAMVEFGTQRVGRAEVLAPAEAARARGLLVFALGRLGRSDEAIAQAQRALEQAHTAGDLMATAAIHSNLGANYIEIQEFTPALHNFRQALQAYQATGSRYGVINIRVNLATVELLLHRFQSAHDLYLQVIDESRSIGARRLEGTAHANLAGALCELGELQGGYSAALEALRILLGAGDRRMEAFAHNNAQMAAHALGRWADALTHARAAREGFAAAGHQSEAWANAAMAVRCLQLLGEHAQAQAEAEALLTEVREGGGWGGNSYGPYYLYRALSDMSDKRAGTLLVTAHQILGLEADRVAAYVPRDVYLRSEMISRDICEAWAAAHQGGDADLTGVAAAS
jgi:predicted ATPase/class 3 adenylate cyclase